MGEECSLGLIKTESMLENKFYLDQRIDQSRRARSTGWAVKLPTGRAGGEPAIQTPSNVLKA